MTISQLLYVSDAKAALSAGELQKLVAHSVKRNAERDVTGLLLYSAGNFVQLLEGDGLVLEELFEKISRDTRHHNVERLYVGRSAWRLFPKWSMGLLNTDGFSEMDRADLRKTITLLKHDPKASVITAVFRAFRNRLPAIDHTAERVAEVQRKIYSAVDFHC